MTVATALLEVVEPPPGGEMIVAVSGGADSAFLAWAIAQNATPRLVHVDHGTAASPILRDAAQDLAAHLGLPLETIVVVVPDGPSWEAQARIVRRGALEEAAGGGVIVTGHHHDDQVETLLGNLMRGAGATGLSGMRAPSGRWHRPLLRLTRSDIRKAVAELGLPYAEDPSNDDLEITRNRIRHRVLPVLEKASHGIGDRLVTTGELLAADDAALETAAGSLAVRVGDGTVSLPVGELRAVPVAVASRTVRRAIRILDGTYPGSSSDIATVLDIVSGSASRGTLGGGFAVRREHGMVVLGPISTGRERWSETGIEVPGWVDVAGCKITARRDDGLTPVGRRRARLWLAPDVTVAIRPAAVGDRIDIGTGSKLVSDAMREADVPVAKRSSWPVVVADARIAWVAGVRAAAWTTVRSGTDAVLFEMGAI